MRDIFNLFFIIVALVLAGAFATFLFVLNTEKDKIWERIYERINKDND